MNPEKLNQAQQCLDIIDVIQRTSMCRLAADYYPQREAAEQLALQYKHHVVRSEVFAVDEENTDAPYLFRVFIDLGVRWHMVSGPDEVEDHEPDDEKDAADAAGVIEASYVAEYRLSNRELDAEALDLFALHNASYHVWPYFREFVTTQCGRMAGPRLTMPMIQLASNRNLQPATIGPN